MVFCGINDSQMKEERYEWSLEIEEYKYTLEQARKLNSIFTQYDITKGRVLLSNHDDLKKDDTT